ncbi:MAG TPA: hypothetical protein VNO52_15880, partial [Methylomirabilota bacterium]|nr:hypothetical protein [Methylomirabilota bacterium]
MIAVRIDKDGFVRDFRRIIATARRPRAVLAAAGREAANRLRAHFRARHRENPNKLGGKRQNFWLHVMRSTQSPVVDEGANTVTISITHPAFAQKVFGGTIRAKRVRNLAIPQTAEAYGRAPSVLEHEAGIKLFVLRANGRAWLAAAQDGSNLK